MTLLYFDGFETYGPGEDFLTEAQDVYDCGEPITAGEVSFESSDRVPDGQLMQINTGSISDNDLSFHRSLYVPVVAYSSEDTWIAGVALRIVGGYVGSTAYCHVFDWLDPNGAAMISLRLRGNGDLQVAEVNPPDATNVIQTYVAAIPDPTVWHYIEGKFTFHASSGSVEIKVDGTLLTPAVSGVRTSLSGVTRPGTMRLGHFQSRQTQFDDFYLCDDQGAAPTNDFLNTGTTVGGSVFVRRIRPDATGESAQFTAYPDTGEDNYEDVAEDTEDGDFTYVESNTVGQKDLYNYEDIDPLLTNTIYGVIAKPVMTKTGGGTRTYQLLAKNGGNEDNSGARYPPSAGSYVRQTHIWTTDPATAAAWTPVGFNTAQFGLEILS